MKILLSNDDGIQAEGLIKLVEVMQQIAEIFVVAPDRNRSGASNSLTLDNPLRAKYFANGHICVEGTPTDCVHLALTGLLQDTPDMVIAGINAGSNLGDDVLYSGTVAAAMEGRSLGYPSIAVSLVSFTNSSEFNHFDTAAEVVKKIVLQLQTNPLPAPTILNINVPDVPLHQLQGFEITRLGKRHLAEPITKLLDPRGRPIYWIGPAGSEQDAGPGTDFYAINNRKVAITPIQVDLTHFEAIATLTEWSVRAGLN